MDYQIITQPTALPVTMQEAQLSAKVDGDELDAKLTLSIKSIVSRAEHLMRRAVMEQVWQAKAAVFPVAIRLINPPVIEIQWIKYLDASGIEQALDPQSYYVDVGDETYIYSKTSWPQTLGLPGAVKVQYKCGYGALPDDVPAAIKDYVLATLAECFDSNQKAGIDLTKPSFVESMLDRYKVWS